MVTIFHLFAGHLYFFPRNFYSCLLVIFNWVTCFFAVKRLELMVYSVHQLLIQCIISIILSHCTNYLFTMLVVSFAVQAVDLIRHNPICLLLENACCVFGAM